MKKVSDKQQADMRLVQSDSKRLRKNYKRAAM
jgi:hypothetical protein